MRSIMAGVCLLAFGLTAPAAQAGMYGDDFARCLVRSTSPSDQVSFIAWVYSALSLHPAVRRYSSMTAAQRSDINRSVGALYTRLIAVDCRAEAVAALKFEGDGALQPAFKVFGEVAMRGLLTDPSVNQGMAQLADDVDQAKLKEVYKEAGISFAEPSPGR